jgi:hypothetical protein
MAIGSYREEFPDFDDELPVIDGFSDQSWHNDACPRLIDDELHLVLYVDYLNPALSDLPEAREAGMGRYVMKHLDEENYVLQSDDDLVIDTDDFLAVLAKIEEIRQQRSPAF